MSPLANVVPAVVKVAEEAVPLQESLSKVGIAEAVSEPSEPLPKG
jgi:hypothetical protein